MIAFFVILALLMVFVVVAGQWSGAGPARRRVVHDRDVVVDRGLDLIEEEIVDDPYPQPVARSRRVVRRRRSY